MTVDEEASSEDVEKWSGVRTRAGLGHTGCAVAVGHLGPCGRWAAEGHLKWTGEGWQFAIVTLLSEKELGEVTEYVV